MPDTLDFGGSGGDPNPVDPQVFAQWVRQAQEKLAAGGTLGPNEIPTGYKVEGNQLVQDTELGSSLAKGLLGTAAGALAGWALPAAAGVGAAAQGAGAAGAGSGVGAAGGGVGSIAAGAGGVGGAAAGAAAGGAGAATGLLPSASSVPNTGALVPATSSLMTGATATAKAAGLPDWLKNAQDIGSALSSASAGRAAGRVAEGTANQNQTRAAVDLYNTELGAPARIARNAVKGDILANAQDVSIDAPSTIPVPTISGGLRPSMFSPTTRGIGTTITNNARDSANNLTPLTPPTLPPLPEAGAFDSALNIGSGIANVAGSVPWDKIPWAKIAGAF